MRYALPGYLSSPKFEQFFQVDVDRIVGEFQAEMASEHHFVIGAEGRGGPYIATSTVFFVTLISFSGTFLT